MSGSIEGAMLMLSITGCGGGGKWREAWTARARERRPVELQADRARAEVGRRDSEVL